ncbi:MAG: hypothetical protein RLQ25_09605 [Alphaproteobacteria bacterium]
MSDMSDTADTTRTESIAGAALDLAARHGWRNVTLGMIARQCGVPLVDLSPDLTGRQAVYTALADALVRRALQENEALGGDESARDRLFAMIMASFDLLAAHRAGALDVLAAMRRDPARLAWGWRRLVDAARRILRAAAPAEPDGHAGQARPCAGVCDGLGARVIAGVWLAGLRAWKDEDSPDMPATMAALDRALDRAYGLRTAIADPRAAVGRFRDQIRGS